MGDDGVAANLWRDPCANFLASPGAPPLDAAQQLLMRRSDRIVRGQTA